MRSVRHPVEHRMIPHDAGGWYCPCGRWGRLGVSRQTAAESFLDHHNRMVEEARVDALVAARHNTDYTDDHLRLGDDWRNMWQRAKDGVEQREADRQANETALAELRQNR